MILEYSFGTLRIETTRIGEDLLVTVSGGERPHIGSVVLSEPRPSLSGDGSTSCTSSVLNRVGHKDEQICRYLAEKACKKYGVAVVCTGGFHMDDMSAEQIREVISSLDGVDV